MKVLCRGRGCGKSHEALLEAGRTGATIVCSHDQDARRLKYLAKEMGLKIPDPVVYSSAPEQLNGRSGGVIVDNADEIIRNLLRHHVDAMTTTAVVWEPSSD